MSGQTAACRRRYSSRRSGRTCSVKQTRLMWSEVELVDVRRVERGRVAEEHLAVGADGELTELAGGELVALLAADRARRKRARRVPGQVAQFLRVPQRERLAGAVLHERSEERRVGKECRSRWS